MLFIPRNHFAVQASAGPPPIDPGQNDMTLTPRNTGYGTHLWYEEDGIAAWDRDFSVGSNVQWVTSPNGFGKAFRFPNQPGAFSAQDTAWSTAGGTGWTADASSTRLWDPGSDSFSYVFENFIWYGPYASDIQMIIVRRGTLDAPIAADRAATFWQMNIPSNGRVSFLGNLSSIAARSDVGFLPIGVEGQLGMSFVRSGPQDGEARWVFHPYGSAAKVFTSTHTLGHGSIGVSRSDQGLVTSIGGYRPYYDKYAINTTNTSFMKPANCTIGKIWFYRHALTIAELGG